VARQAIVEWTGKEWAGKAVSTTTRAATRAGWLVAVVLLAACANQGATTPPPAQAPVAPAVSAAPRVPVATGALSDPGRPVKVALLLPLSGTNGPLGSAMLNAAQLSLFDQGNDSFELLPRDTKGTRAGTVEAANGVLAGGAKLVLGPLLGADAAAIKSQAQTAGVPVLSFSNDWTIAGGNLYVMGFGPQEQVVRVAGFARARGLSRFSVLAPRSLYGDAVVASLRSTAQRLGATVVREERYQADGSDLAATVQRLGAGGSAAPATPAYGGSAYGSASTYGSGAPDSEALLIAEGGERLVQIARLLPGAHIDPSRTKLLGTGQWDEKSLGREPILVGGWYAAPDPDRRADFEARFQSLYGEAPPRLATLAYDATALAAVLAQRGSFSGATLTDRTGFLGLDGVFRLLPTGQTERALAVLEVTPDRPRVIDPAASSLDALLN